MRQRRYFPLLPLFIVVAIGGLDSHTAAFSSTVAFGGHVSYARYTSRVQSIYAATKRVSKERMRLKMTESEGDERKKINNRMASELERVSSELSRMGMFEEEGYEPASSVVGGRARSFTAQELEALNMLIGQVPASNQEEDADRQEIGAVHHGSTISCGGETYSSSGHSAVVSGDGRLFVWGSGEQGRLGTASIEGELAPVHVGGVLATVRRQGLRIRSVSCGFDHSACVTDDGRVFVWGSGTRGQVHSQRAERGESPHKYRSSICMLTLCGVES